MSPPASCRPQVRPPGGTEGTSLPGAERTNILPCNYIRPGRASQGQSDMQNIHFRIWLRLLLPHYFSQSNYSNFSNETFSEHKAPASVVVLWCHLIYNSKPQQSLVTAIKPNIQYYQASKKLNQVLLKI